MRIDILETHDRLEHVVKQPFDIGKTCQEIIDRRPFGDHAFYIFAHKRQIDIDERISIFNMDCFTEKKYKSLEDVPTHRIVWQPRLTKPMAQENSMLFKGYPGTDLVKTIWIIPEKETWKQFEKGKMTENELVAQSIHDFKTNRAKLEAPEDDDLPDDIISRIYTEISKEARQEYKKI